MAQTDQCALKMGLYGVPYDFEGRASIGNQDACILGCWKSTMVLAHTHTPAGSSLISSGPHKTVQRLREASLQAAVHLYTGKQDTETESFKSSPPHGCFSQNPDLGARVTF